MKNKKLLVAGFIVLALVLLAGTLLLSSKGKQLDGTNDTKVDTSTASDNSNTDSNIADTDKPSNVDTSEAPRTILDKIEITDSGFTPQTINIIKGTKVTWTNKGLMPHAISSTEGLFRSPKLNPGDSYIFTFNTIGSFEYYCTITGSSMKGTVVVE
jgi:plastocyanin